MKKIIYILLTLIVIAVITAMVFINPIAKKQAQAYAQALLKTPVSISQFDASLLDKTLRIDFIEVQNPPNFKNKNAFSVDHFVFKIGDVDSNLVTVDTLKFDGIAFVLEQSGTRINLTELANNVKVVEKRSAESGDKSDNQRVKIKRFMVENMRLIIDTDWLKTTLKVPSISSTNFGGGSGVRVDEMGKRVVSEILQNLEKALKKKGIEVGKQEIEATLKRKITQKLGIDADALEGVKDAINTDALKNKSKDLLKGFGF